MGHTQLGDGRDLHNVAARPMVLDRLTDIASLDIPTLRHTAAFDPQAMCASRKREAHRYCRATGLVHKPSSRLEVVDSASRGRM